MTELKRYPLKYIRDYVKKDYKLRDECFVCGTKSNLELHHLYSVSELFNNWLIKNKIPEVTTVEQITVLRVDFAEDCEDKLNNSNLVTLCSTHHKQLHTLYGQRYSNHQVPKVRRWLGIQKDKYVE